MPKANFTEDFLQRLSREPPPAGKKLDYFDKSYRRLLVRHNYGGKITFCALHFIDGVDRHGKPKKIPSTKQLGMWPNLTLKEAWEKSRKFDPQQAAKDARERAATRTFQQVAETWIAEHVDGGERPLRSRAEIVRQLTKYVYPQWSGRAIRDLRRIDVKDLLRKIDREHGPSMADYVLRTVRSLMMWYAEEDEDFRVPIVRPRRDRRSRENRARDRYLDDEEIRQLWHACEQCGMYGILTKLLLLTGQRLRKVAHMQWSDLSKDGVWTIRTEPGEKGNAGAVQLPASALALIHALPRVEGNPHVFPAAHGLGPTSSFTDLKRATDQRLPPNMTPWVLHDLRRTARSLLARERLKVPDHIAERVLGHSLQGVQKIYNRHPYFEEKSEALAKLADEVERIVNPPQDNVVALRRSGRTRRARAR